MSNPEINPTAASLLGFLHAGPMTGWDLDRAVRDTISNFWNVTRSQIYRELRALAELGYVQAGESGPRDRRPHLITPAGREAFAIWMTRDPGPALVRFPLLLMVFFGEHLPPHRLEEIVSAERESCLKQLDEFVGAHEHYKESEPYVAAVLRFAIGYEQLMLNWIESLPQQDGTEPSESDIGQGGR